MLLFLLHVIVKLLQKVWKLKQRASKEDANDNANAGEEIPNGVSSVISYFFVDIRVVHKPYMQRIVVFGT